MTKTCYYCTNAPKKAPPGYKPLWCEKHDNPKKSIYTNRVHCKILKCKKIPKYGYAGDKIATLCKLHKESQMINITASDCIYEYCTGKAIFGGLDNIPKYCRSHNTQNTNFRIQRCAFMTCRNIPKKKYKNIFCDKHIIYGKTNVCLLCTNITIDELYCDICNLNINRETTKLFDNIDVAATDYRLVPNTIESIDSSLKKEIDFSIKLEYIPIQILLNELDSLDKIETTFDFIIGIPEITNEPYVIDDHIDIPNLY